MSLLPETIWAFDVKWDSVTLGPKLNEIGDDFEYVYNEDAVAQVVYLAIRDSDNAQYLVNSHPCDVAERLNQLTEELENKEWSIELGSITLNFDYGAKKLEFSAITAGQVKKPIRFSLNLAGEGDV